jgi:hypothetical protein
VARAGLRSEREVAYPVEGFVASARLLRQRTPDGLGGEGEGAELGEGEGAGEVPHAAVGREVQAGGGDDGEGGAEEGAAVRAAGRRGKTLS